MYAYRDELLDEHDSYFRRYSHAKRIFTTTKEEETNVILRHTLERSDQSVTTHWLDNNKAGKVFKTFRNNAFEYVFYTDSFGRRNERRSHRFNLVKRTSGPETVSKPGERKY